MDQETLVATDPAIFDFLGAWRIPENSRGHNGVLVDRENMGPNPRG